MFCGMVRLSTDSPFRHGCHGDQDAGAGVPSITRRANQPPGATGIAPRAASHFLDTTTGHSLDCPQNYQRSWLMVAQYEPCCGRTLKLSQHRAEDRASAAAPVFKNRRALP